MTALAPFRAKRRRETDKRRWLLVMHRYGPSTLDKIHLYLSDASPNLETAWVDEAFARSIDVESLIAKATSRCAFDVTRRRVVHVFAHPSKRVAEIRDSCVRAADMAHAIQRRGGVPPNLTWAASYHDNPTALERAFTELTQWCKLAKVDYCSSAPALETLLAVDWWCAMSAFGDGVYDPTERTEHDGLDAYLVQCGFAPRSFIGFAPYDAFVHDTCRDPHDGLLSRTECSMEKCNLQAWGRVYIR